MLAKIPEGRHWSSKWSSLQINSKEDSEGVISNVLGESRSDKLELDSTLTDMNSHHSFILGFQRYARIVKSSKRSKLVASFRGLVFLSMYITLKAFRILSPQELHTSRSIAFRGSKEYFRRLLRGAIWVNDVVNQL